MTIQKRLIRSNIIMFVIPILVAAALLFIGMILAFLLLKRICLPQLGISLQELHQAGEQMEHLLSGSAIIFYVYVGTDATICTDGTDGLRSALNEPYDLLLLDLMLPGTDGFTICRTVREKKDIPILMVTALDKDVDKIRGLGFGADDYIGKPFSPSVLVARVKAHLAQYQRLKPTAEKQSKSLTVGVLTAEEQQRLIFKDGLEIPLKNKEYELLLFLMRHPGQVFSREDLYEIIWGLESMGDNATVAVHINRLREKIEDDPSHPKLLQTVWGVGYRLSKGV